ncbi:hypothetical protein KP78_33480 [Jeotgalibacillus soli]|uniref:Cyclic nucleotide-binding domain-containing protein n=2 Tax=Jeotgalibacillus soli TaxID=889306 RepID=A0A0C2RRK3_9BACL|nr:hypothetical protein KP78_33480 [Jeotgalibacillus soli]
MKELSIHLYMLNDADGDEIYSFQNGEVTVRRSSEEPTRLVLRVNLHGHSYSPVAFVYNDNK